MTTTKKGNTIKAAAAAATAAASLTVATDELKPFQSEKEADNALLNTVQISEKARNAWLEFGIRLALWLGTMEKVDAYCQRDATRDAITRGLPQEMRVLLSVSRADTPKESLKARDAAAAQQSTYLSRVKQYAKDAIEGKAKKGERTAQDKLDNAVAAGERFAKALDKVEGEFSMHKVVLGYIVDSLKAGTALEPKLIGVVAMIQATKK